ncbi:hypothetical protein [Tabrizicola sp. BL-A-41-H6]|uniref:hypothetical protein n=1 Tax=Tabrizicola sp. BL-A-41-H6 TaxID=3421107 RepID=UPI003D67023B
MRQTDLLKFLALVLLCLSLALGGLHRAGPGDTDLAADQSQTASHSHVDTADPDHPPLAHPTTTTAHAAATLTALATAPGRPTLARAGPRRPPRDAVQI